MMHQTGKIILKVPGVPSSFKQEFIKKSLNVTKSEKLVKVCLLSSKAEQISLQFDEYF